MVEKMLTRNETKELLKTYGSPLYVYNESILRKQAKQISTFLNDTGIDYSCHYAVKANCNPHILRIIKECGMKFDSMSPGELVLTNATGAEVEDILYVCNNISEDEMTSINEMGILMVLDSVSQLETFGKSCPNSNIMIRINPGTIGVGHSEKVITSGNTTKFGINQEYFQEVKSIANKYNLKIIGIHQHLGSLFLNDKISDYINGVKAGLELAKQFKDLQIIDLGGGFGIPYKPEEDALSLEELKEQLIPVLNQFISEYGQVHFKFEPGRFVVAEAGVLIGTINSIKKNAETTFIGTDIGMGILVRPSMYNAYHHIETLTENDNCQEIIATVVGNVCESGDILGKNRKLKLPEIGDPIIVYDAGAYGTTMASNYTGRVHPAEVLTTEQNKFVEIKPRQTEEDILKQYNFI